MGNWAKLSEFFVEGGGCVSIRIGTAGLQQCLCYTTHSRYTSKFSNDEPENLLNSGRDSDACFNRYSCISYNNCSYCNSDVLSVL